MIEENKIQLIAHLEMIISHVRENRLVYLTSNVDLHREVQPNSDGIDVMVRLPGADYEIKFTLMPEPK